MVRSHYSEGSHEFPQVSPLSSSRTNHPPHFHHRAEAMVEVQAEALVEVQAEALVEVQAEAQEARKALGRPP